MTLATLRRSPVSLAAPAALAMALAACPSGGEAEHRAPRLPGVVEYYGEAARVELPDTVRAGEAFAVVVTTYGNGCVSAAGTEVRVRGRTAEVTPYDHDQARAPGGAECTDELNRFAHRAALRFPSPGPALVRVHGLREPGAAAVTVERRVVVR
ncbi:MAG TPA: hypothetical protein VHG91_04780 [Longimicrobium sp.]|nr:hypothetical protein [Longimicrobium sp.]